MGVVLAKTALLQLHRQASLLKPLKHFSKLLEVLSPTVAEHNNVINIGLSKLSDIHVAHGFMVFWNVAGALCSPKGITSKSYNPKGVANAVFSRESAAMEISQ